MVDNQGLRHTAFGVELESELFIKRGKQRWPVGLTRAPFEYEIVSSRQAGLIGDFPPCIPFQAFREQTHGDGLTCQFSIAAYEQASPMFLSIGRFRTGGIGLVRRCWLNFWAILGYGERIDGSFSLTHMNP